GVIVAAAAAIAAAPDGLDPNSVDCCAGAPHPAARSASARAVNRAIGRKKAMVIEFRIRSDAKYHAIVQATPYTSTTAEISGRHSVPGRGRAVRALVAGADAPLLPDEAPRASGREAGCA